MTNFAGVTLQTVGKKDASLLSLLENRDVRTFRARCAESRGRLDEHDDKYTYLQYACLYGLTDAVESLLTNGANPNLTCHPDQCPPIMMAGRQGYYNIVELLAQHDNVNFECTLEGTVLHAVLDGMTKAHDALGPSFDIKKHVRCLEHLLKKVSPNLLDINAQNKDGHTALHLAVKLHQKCIIRLLLDHGAYIGSRCNRGNMAISRINANVFKEYLDDCIVTNNKLPIDENFEIIYKYQFLVPPRKCPYEARQTGGAYFEPEVGTGDSAHAHDRAPISETEPLIELSRVPELRHLLKHPVITSFLNLKWFTIRKYFWVNFTFYLTFWICLTLHTLVVYSPLETTNVASQRALFERRQAAPVAVCTWYPSIVLCGLFFLREFFQFSVSPTRYLYDVENLLDVALLVSNLMILLFPVGAEFAAVALLLTWIELVMLINRHPSLSPNIEMYKVVCTSFLKLLAWCSMLIIAFALSFYLLFKDTNHPICTQKNSARNSTTKNEGDKNNDNNEGAKFFESTKLSFFKVILMMTGEFETSSIPFDCHPGVSHVVFVVFVFLVAIVLFNLMNGLAVSDTQAIRSDAEIVGNVSRAKLIAYIETMATANPLNCFNIFDGVKCCRCCYAKSKRIKRAGRRSTWQRPIRVFYEHANLFPYVLPDSSAHVFPNRDNLVDKPNDDVKRRGQKLHSEQTSCWTAACHKYADWYISYEIVNATKEILVQKSEREEKESCSHSMERYSAKLEEYGKRLNQLEETTKRKLNEVIELLKKKR